MKSILIINDDGINSTGIKAAVEAVNGLADITLVAPAVQQSGVGRSISLFSPILISEVEFGSGVNAYSISGTPTDAVVIGIHGILKKKPDLIISGINIGENLSTEATTSGTVGAAMEGANQGVPSIAISLHSGRVKSFNANSKMNFATAKKILRILAEHILTKGMPKGIEILNVNIPEKPTTKIRITRLAKRMYTTKLEKRLDPRGREYFWIDGDEIHDAEEGTDVHAVRVENAISITPLKLDFTCYEGIEELEKLLAEFRFKL